MPPTDKAVNSPWPLAIQQQAPCIAAAIAQYGVPANVFMGMYQNETTLGTLRNPDGSIKTSPTGAVGPFQFEPSTAQIYGYPITSTPTLAEFQAQANGAAHYLHDLYIDAAPSVKSWHYALAAYNAGPGNYRAGNSYADKALAFTMPAEWRSALTNAGTSNLGPAGAGGTANAGGTGTLPNDLTSGFRVGDSTNPDEDYWTAMNRIAQERYWYIFSDGETLYLADGPDLMKQAPALTVDRVAQSGNISRLEFTWDNTAWTYAVTHRRRKRAQRRTSLAKVTSPVEAQLEYICAIDEVRAGDVVEMSNCGPGDGKWLVGDCRRSVFDVFSEINLVVALTPLTEGQLNPAGINQANVTVQYGSGQGVGNVKGYVNPVGNWIPNRIDAGVDGTLSGPYVAPGDSQILQADRSNAGWNGGGYIAGKLTSGPLAGKVWYVAEGITPVVPVGANVKAGTPVGQPAVSPYGNSYGQGATGAIETGWADPSIPALPLGFVNNKDDQGPIALAAGNSFNRFLTKLGAKPGSISGRGIGVAPASLPGGYP